MEEQPSQMKKMAEQLKTITKGQVTKREEDEDQWQISQQEQSLGSQIDPNLQALQSHMRNIEKALQEVIQHLHQRDRQQGPEIDL